MTIILVAITCIISFLCFSSSNLFNKLQFNPYRIYHNKQYYRILSHAFVHADWIHLIVNMIVLFSFGTVLETMDLPALAIFGQFHLPGYSMFFILYFTAIVISSISTLKKFMDSVFYNSVGASGAVSAVLFATIFFNPWDKVYVFFAIPIPGIIFGVIYLWYSNYMSRKNSDNINHDAHFLGALYGFSFPIILDPRSFYDFIIRILHPNF